MDQAASSDAAVSTSVTAVAAMPFVAALLLCLLVLMLGQGLHAR